MPSLPLDRFVRQLRQSARPAEARTDGELLAAFLADRDDEAFAFLVRRHGPTVFGVCRRVLRDRHDAEDAFQATFLLLARQAASLRRREAVAAWLYGVALRTARKARVRAARRRLHEGAASALLRPDAVAAAEDRDWQPLLDREIAGLPEKYRLPVLLCDLAGQPRRDAARQLGVAEGTLSSRLVRAHDLLRAAQAPRCVADARRARRGDGRPTNLGGVARTGTRDGSVNSQWHCFGRDSHSRGRDGACHVVDQVQVRGGRGGLCRPVVRRAGRSNHGRRRGVVCGPVGRGRDARGAGATEAQSDRERLQGSWVFVRLTFDGESAKNSATESNAKTLDGLQIEFSGDEFTARRSALTSRGRFTLDERSHPHRLRLTTTSDERVPTQDIDLTFENGLLVLTPQTATVGPMIARMVFRKLGTAAEGTMATERDLAALQGDWRIISIVNDGEVMANSAFAQTYYRFDKDQMLVLHADARAASSAQTTFKLDPTQKPKHIDLMTGRDRSTARTTRGIYALEGDTLMLCLSADPERRPETLTGKVGSKQRFIVMRRDTPTTPAAGLTPDDIGKLRLEALGLQVSSIELQKQIKELEARNQELLKKLRDLADRLDKSQPKRP